VPKAGILISPPNQIHLFDPNSKISPRRCAFDDTTTNENFSNQQIGLFVGRNVKTRSLLPWCSVNSLNFFSALSSTQPIQRLIAFARLVATEELLPVAPLSLRRRSIKFQNRLLMLAECWSNRAARQV
jgi:hypothetical protein